MIRSFRHRGLKLVHLRGGYSGIHAAHRKKIVRILGYLNVARMPRDMDFPGLRLHPLTGNLAGFWSVTVSANWRIVFRFEGIDVVDVDLVDYH
ncbi:type II toxin-antitoxin system RelE/ParE family toxin [Bradyrhizobium sp.]|uniref:type II toxin-antitoxin system RelE/ParE family toxin n=1 Tax=Bradyrhizobium sp. TaxID=376 RepID=UPI002D38B8B5|nr:type II toxin-antitoxin system RelE/ParE family toxin [Bradyrhizobium sp.]HZR77044.1 type II toxin-antitoxin system RelE/ParE family toxin [Bradyrhizobium sp.]